MAMRIPICTRKVTVNNSKFQQKQPTYVPRSCSWFGQS
uniref:Uncharacterized protein n=1 Tax=Rhizophora mucronata TaxID=61149 RepID=A0A2P2PED2_RHIMU